MKILSVVFNSLDTDSRVQRSSDALTEIGDVTLIGIGNEYNNDNVNSIALNIKSRHNLLRYFEFIFKTKKIMKQIDYDLFFANDFYCAELVLWAKRRNKKLKIVYDAHELYIPYKGQRLNSRFKFFYRKEKMAINIADLVLCANQDRAKIMKEYYGLNSDPIAIRNISKLPRTDNTICKKHENETDSFFKQPGITLVYAGVLSSTRRIESLIEILEKKPDTKLLIIGEGSHRAYLEQIARPLGSRVLFTGTIPYVNLSVLLSRCDIGYLYYPTDILNNIYCAPNKIYEYSSVRLPMISNANPTLEKILNNNSIGISSDDLFSAFTTVSKNLDKYKSGCDVFNIENQWKDEKVKLINCIRRLNDNYGQI